MIDFDSDITQGYAVNLWPYDRITRKLYYQPNRKREYPDRELCAVAFAYNGAFARITGRWCAY